MADGTENVFKKKEARVIIALFFIVVAFLSIMNVYEKYAPSIIGNNKPINAGGSCGLIYFRNKRIDKIEPIIEKSGACIYSDEDITEAIETIKNDYKSKDDNIGLCSVKFSEIESADFLKDYNGIEQYGKENVIAVFCSYNIYENCDLGEGGYYENRAMVLARDAKTSEWEIIDPGY